VPTIKHSTATVLNKRDKTSIWNAIKPVISIYSTRGFHLIDFRSDGGVECMKELLLAQGVKKVSIVSNNEHESHIERHHKTVEERVRCLISCFVSEYGLKRDFIVPKSIITAAVRFVNLMLNMIPMETGISSTLSPAAIIEDMHLNYERHCQLRFLEYVLIHNESNSDLSPRVSAALNLGPVGDQQRNHLFYNIATNKIVKRLVRKSTQCPMPDDVPTKLHQTALKERMPVGISFDNDGEENMDKDNDDDISLGDHAFVPNPVDPIDLIMSDDFVPVDDDEIESLMQDEMPSSEEQLSEDSLDAAESEKIEELLNDESSSIQQDINESLEVNESKRHLPYSRIIYIRQKMKRFQYRRVFPTMNLIQQKRMI